MRFPSLRTLAHHNCEYQLTTTPKKRNPVNRKTKEEENRGFKSGTIKIKHGESSTRYAEHNTVTIKIKKAENQKLNTVTIKIKRETRFKDDSGKLKTKYKADTTNIAEKYHIQKHL